MSDRLEDDRPAKKLKLDEPESAPAAPAVPEPAPNPFSWAGEGGLFASLVDTLGKRASTEPEVGISEYVDPEIPPFSGIIKHRCARARSPFAFSASSLRGVQVHRLPQIGRAHV